MWMSKRHGGSCLLGAIAFLVAMPASAGPTLRIYAGKPSRLDPIQRGQLRHRLEQQLAPCQAMGNTAEGDLKVTIALDGKRAPTVRAVADGVSEVIARCLEDALATSAWDGFPAKLRWEGTLRYRDGDRIDVTVRSSDSTLEPELLRNVVAAALEQRTGGPLAVSCLERFFAGKPAASATLRVTLDGARATAASSTGDVHGARACVSSMISSIKLPRGERAELFVALLRPVHDTTGAHVLTSGD